jgi:hypothetical protein
MGAKKIEDFPTILCITVGTDKYCSIAGGLQAFVQKSVCIEVSAVILRNLLFCRRTNIEIKGH